MNAADALELASAAGVELALEGGKLKARGAADVVQAWVPALRQHKNELLALLENSRVTTELLMAAMRACDHHGDGPQAREEMRRQLLETPPHLRGDLLAHFKREYPTPTAD